MCAGRLAGKMGDSPMYIVGDRVRLDGTGQFGTVGCVFTFETGERRLAVVWDSPGWRLADEMMRNHPAQFYRDRDLRPVAS